MQAIKAELVIDYTCVTEALWGIVSSVKRVMEDIWTKMILEATWVTDTTQNTEIPEVMEALKVIEYIHVMKAT